MIVRLEQPADRDRSIAVERAAFGTPEEASIVEAVRDDPGSFALVADEHGEIVGHVQMSRAWVGEAGVMALGPVGVLPQRQGRGIGSALVRGALEEASRRDELAVILLGTPAYYGRFGFAPARGLGLSNPFAGVLDSGFAIDEEDFQIAVLDEPRATLLTGEVRWHRAFG